MALMLALLALAAEDVFGECLDFTTFEDATVAAGLRGYGNSRGVNLNDFDADGDIDIFIATAPAIVEYGLTLPGDDRLFLNDGTGHFTEPLDAMGLNDVCEDRASFFGDLDNDGDNDLYETVNGRNVLWRNDGTWVDASATSGDGDARNWGHQGFLFDYDEDGWVDIFYTNGPEDGSGFNVLLHNQRDGTFIDVAAAAGVLGNPSGEGNCVLDVDNNGWPDIVVNSGREFGNQLFMNQGDGTFVDEAIARGVSDPLRRFGTGVDCGDINNDGYGDILMVTHDHTFSGNNLFLNGGPAAPGMFTDVATERGVAPWVDGHASGFVDVDLDGWLDIGVFGIGLPAFVLLNDRTGSFDRACNSAGASQDGPVSWGFGAGDLDGDFYPDLYITNGLLKSPRDDIYFHNLGGSAHALTVSTRTAVGKRAAFGARVEVEAGGVVRTDWVGSWASFDSQGPLALTFGVGTSTVIDRVTVTFPSGQVVEQRDVAVDQALTIDEPGGVDDADHDGVPDPWDLCPETPSRDRRDGAGCAPWQRGGGPLAASSPREDEVWLGPGTFSWIGTADSWVVQVSWDGTFGPAGRVDLGPVSTPSVTMDDTSWRTILANLEGSAPVVWRVVSYSAAGGSTVSVPRRLSVAFPNDRVYMPMGVNVFEPSHIVVDAGTTVTFVNESVAEGNLQNEGHDVALVDEHGNPLLALAELAGSSTLSLLFDTPGTWSYVCNRHSGVAVNSEGTVEGTHYHHPIGPYRCMSGTVTVR